jgi:hypothetical protein
VWLSGGGSLHLRGTGPPDYASASQQQMASYFSTHLPRLIAAAGLSANDTVVVSDMASHRTHDATGLRAAAESLVAFARQAPEAPRLVWLDYQAPHHPRQPTGEFSHGTCSGSPLARPPPPAVPLLDYNGTCRPHTCDSEGAGATAAQLLTSAGIEVVHRWPRHIT